LERCVGFDEAALQVAASLAVASRHPLARSLVAAAGPVAMAEGAVEVPGQGVRARDVKLGCRGFVVTNDRVRPEDGRDEGEGPEMWLARFGVAPVRFGFVETLREDAAVTLTRLRAMGLDVQLLSGDRASAVWSVAQAIGIGTWQAEQTPAQKVAAIEALMAAGRKVLMVGDGLNDGPSLAAATVSASPATAADVSQTVADVVFQGARLAPVAVVIETARRARGVMRQNLALSIGYNVLMVPLAVAGFVTPWLAAAAMSSSSLAVMLNSFRLRGGSA
jgi:Cu2+-exporting ATPase